MKTEVNYNELTISQLEGRLKPRERAFVEHYDECGIGTVAAQRAGYSPDNKDAAAVAASRLLRSDKIAAYRRARAKELYERLGITKESLALRLEELRRRAMGGDPVKEYDKETGEYKIIGSYEFDGRAAAKALELMGNMIGAYEQKINANVTTHSVEEYLAGLDTGSAPAEPDE